ncbi:MAG: hypothetical protein AAF708_07790, partial [Deinococcota bacterium]
MKASKAVSIFVLICLSFFSVALAQFQWQVAAIPGASNVKDLHAEGDVIYVVTDAGLVASTDNGVSWTMLREDSTIHVVHASNDTVMLGTSTGLAISLDAGATWNVTG